MTHEKGPSDFPETVALDDVPGIVLDELEEADKPDALGAVMCELASATRKFGPFHSSHEGLGVLTEEMAEFLEEVRENSVEGMAHEITQVGAMALRFLYDCCGYAVPGLAAPSAPGPFDGDDSSPRGADAWCPDCQDAFSTWAQRSQATYPDDWKPQPAECCGNCTHAEDFQPRVVGSKRCARGQGAILITESCPHFTMKELANADPG